MPNQDLILFLHYSILLKTYLNYLLSIPYTFYKMVKDNLKFYNEDWYLSISNCVSPILNNVIAVSILLLPFILY